VLLVGAEVRSVLAARAVLSAIPGARPSLVVRNGPGRKLDPALVADSLHLELIGVLEQDARIWQAMDAGSPPGHGGGRASRGFDRILDQLGIGDREDRTTRRRRPPEEESLFERFATVLD
jgi:septum formation inhibitor-activating ATPase MinD